MAITFQVGDTLYSLDATKNVSAPLTATLSASPMADNTTQSDNIRVNVPTVRMSGIISDIKTRRTLDTKATGTWVDGIYAIMNSNSSVALKYREDMDPEFGWFITSFDPKQNVTHGVGKVDTEGNVTQAFEIALTFQKPKIAQGLEATTQPPAQYRDALSSRKDKSASTQSLDDGVKGDKARSSAAAKRDEQKELATKYNKIFITGDLPEAGTP